MASVVWRTTVGSELKDQIEGLVQTQRTLEDVVRYGLAQSPPRLICDVVVQDEYTHDVVLQHPSGVYLVYDAT